VEFLLRGFIGRLGGEEFEGLEVVRLHGSVMRGREATAGIEEGGAEQARLGEEHGDEAGDALGRPSMGIGTVTDEFVAGLDHDHGEDERKNERETGGPAAALGGTGEDFGSGGRRGTGHDSQRYGDGEG